MRYLVAILLTVFATNAFSQSMGYSCTSGMLIPQGQGDTYGPANALAILRELYHSFRMSIPGGHTDRLLATTSGENTTLYVSQGEFTCILHMKRDDYEWTKRRVVGVSL